MRVAHLAGVALLLGGSCAPSLAQHERLGALGAGALRICRAQASRCAALVPCVTALRDASKAMQAARVQVAGGTTPSTDATVRATSLPALAESTCKAAGVVVAR